MSKRTADDHGDLPLKGGERPEQMDVDMDKDMGEFEDEFEDEFESEDEIIEAGVDGRPDAEREAEEKERKCRVQHLLRIALGQSARFNWGAAADENWLIQKLWRSIKEPLLSDEAS